MEFKIVSKQNKKDKMSVQQNVSIPVDVLDEVIDLLSNVECTCVWSPGDNEYVKVNDIPSSLLEQLKMCKSLSRLNQT